MASEPPQNQPQTQRPYTEKDIEILDENHSHYDYTFKVILIGDSGVGKSCLSIQATKHNFESNYLATVGFEFFSFVVKLGDKIIKLQIWDTCGQEIYRSLITNFYRNSALAIIVYAINDMKTFEDADFWLKDLKNYSNPDIKVLMIGNKADLEKNRVVSKHMAEKYISENGIIYFTETSAKSGFNVKELFTKAACILYDNFLDTIKDTEEKKYVENLTPTKEKPKTKKCC